MARKGLYINLSTSKHMPVVQAYHTMSKNCNNLVQQTNSDPAANTNRIGP